MLFHLTDTLMGYTPEQEEKVVAGVTNLLIGYFEGKNLLDISDAFYDHFYRVITDDKAKRSLRHLHSYTAYDYNVTKSFNVKLDGYCRHNELLIDYFYNTTSIQPPFIIGENRNDILFYAIVTSIVRHVPEDYLSYQIISGGGRSTSTEFKDKQDKELFALCIVDSDVRYPKASEGGTYGAVNSVYDTRSKFVTLVGIKVHEIENLLPPHFIADYTLDEGKAFVQKLIAKGLEKYLRWYDVKNGISLSDISEPDYNEYAKEMYEQLYSSKVGAYDKHLATCKRKNKKVMPKLRDDLVKRYIRLTDMKRATYNIHFKDEWREIADNFYDYACSRECDPINV